MGGMSPNGAPVLRSGIPNAKAPMIRKFLILTSLFIAMIGQTATASPDAMTPQEARHLISRTGFGAAPHEIAAITGLSYQDGVARILDGMRTEPTLPMPVWTKQWSYPYDQIWALGQTQSELFTANRWLELTELSGWWLAEMAATPSPFTERMVLFWSDHFANSFDEHENSQWMARQNQFLRDHAAGDFAVLAQGMLLDPAMLVYLDNVSNIADAPNENLAREFLELFTLGEGRGYTQDDVRAAARMLTGYGVSDMNSALEFDAELHDSGQKTFLGQTGVFDADDVVEIVLNDANFGPYIVEKLWRVFVSDQPDAGEVERLTQVWIANGLAMKPLLEAMFLTDAFWDPANQGRLVKSPVELIVGTTRTLGLRLPKAQDIAWMVGELDQTLFLPPNVGGWPEGVEWINDATASARATMLTYLLWGARDFAVIDPSPMMRGAINAPPQPPLAKGDFRVGQVFATYAEPRAEGEGLGGLFTLFDVGFAGQNWRSISLWLEYDEGEDFAAIYLFNGDCDGACLTSLPDDGDDDGWVAFAPWDGMLAEYPQITDTDIELMQAIGTHLPALIATTSTHIPFGINVYDPDHQAEDFDPFMVAAHLFAKNSGTEIGRHTGDLVFAFSLAGATGLAGAEMVQVVGDIDAYTEAREQAANRPMAALVPYRTARAWFDALHGQGPETGRAAKTLFAVPQISLPADQSLRVNDPGALLLQLVLSPEYQVN